MYLIQLILTTDAIRSALKVSSSPKEAHMSYPHVRTDPFLGILLTVDKYQITATQCSIVHKFIIHLSSPDLTLDNQGVTEKQEELQMTFLDTLERREKESVATEEAWTTQETQLNEEHDMLVNESSVCGCKNCFYYHVFLQKMKERNNDGV
ncbi:hypothetical protein Tco_0450427 [Tanacetum coccineum]